MTHNSRNPFVAIVDYGLGNLFSVKRALQFLGAQTEITDNAVLIKEADKLIIPGVGSFGDGMKGLEAKGLIEPIKEHANSGRALLGICLGMQLLMTEGEEFGVHEGLGLIRGEASRLRMSNKDRMYKIPHIGWNSLMYPKKSGDREMKTPSLWYDTILNGLTENAFVYFAHSNVVIPDDRSCYISETEYGGTTFCSTVRQGNIYGCQFHPERSGPIGLEIYKNFVFNDGAENES